MTRHPHPGEGTLPAARAHRRAEQIPASLERQRRTRYQGCDEVGPDARLASRAHPCSHRRGVLHAHLGGRELECGQAQGEQHDDRGQGGRELGGDAAPLPGEESRPTVTPQT